MLVGLGELLRSSLERRETRTVALEEELRLLRHYLQIEQVRLGDRLVVEWEVEGDLDDARVPPLLLQPLAENAIRHAIATKIAPAFQRALEAIVKRDCSTRDTPPLCGCITDSAAKAWLGYADTRPKDCVITVEEILTSSIVISAIAPDVTIDGEPALSLGLRLEAVPASF